MVAVAAAVMSSLRLLAPQEEASPPALGEGGGVGGLSTGLPPAGRTLCLSVLV